MYRAIQVHTRTWSLLQIIPAKAICKRPHAEAGQSKANGGIQGIDYLVSQSYVCSSCLYR